VVRRGVRRAVRREVKRLRAPAPRDG
jgi:hypothetical protein